MWESGLKKFLLKEIVPLTTQDKQIHKKLVSDEAMKVWKVAFTHETYNPNNGENYEELEKLGDKVIGLNFTLYLMEAFPGITKKELSELSNYYLSKPELARISSKLHLANWLRSPIKKDIDINEDIFESLFGALFLIGDKVLKRGAGNLLCQRLLYQIFEKEDIDIEKVSKGKPKTQVIELFKKAGWGQVITEWDENNKIYRVKFTQQAVKDLKKMGYQISPDNILAEAEGITKTSAEEEAFKRALNILNSQGFTREWFDQKKLQKELSSPDFSEYLPLIEKKIEEDGYQYVFFSKPRVKEKFVYVQLIGVNPEGRKYVLATAKSDDITKAKKKAMDIYINNKQERLE